MVKVQLTCLVSHEHMAYTDTDIRWRQRKVLGRGESMRLIEGKGELTTSFRTLGTILLLDLIPIIPFPFLLSLLYRLFP